LDIQGKADKLIRRIRFNDLSNKKEKNKIEIQKKER